MPLVLRVFSSVVDRLASSSHVFTDALDGVAGSGGGREQEGQSCKGSFHIGSGHGRVARPFGFALTDPGMRLSRTRLFLKVTRIMLHVASMGA